MWVYLKRASMFLFLVLIINFQNSLCEFKSTKANSEKSLLCKHVLSANIEYTYIRVFMSSFQVMWVRRTTEKVSLLTVGNITYSGDPRIHVKFQYPNNWRLLINPIQREDAGVYMCQVSTHPPRVFTTNLTILGKYAHSHMQSHLRGYSGNWIFFGNAGNTKPISQYYGRRGILHMYVCTC